MAENKTLNDERAAKINQSGPAHDVNEIDASEHGTYDDSAEDARERVSGADTRKSTVKPY